MTDEQRSDDTNVKEAAASIDRFVAHIGPAMQAIPNLRWEEVEFHLGSMESIAKTADASEKPLMDALYEPIRKFALGFKQVTTAKSPEDQEKALEELTGARDSLRKLMTEQREITENPAFVLWTLGIEGQILGVQSSIAASRGEAEEAARLSQQSEHVLDDMMNRLGPDEPLYHFFAARKQFQDAMQRLNRGTQALVEMNLDLAQQYLESSAKDFTVMRDHLKKANLDGLMFNATKNTMEGFGLLVDAQDTYVRALRTAVIGDVNRSDVIALERAESSFLDGGDLISSGVAAIPNLFGNLDMKPAAQGLSKLTHNLRTLCERSLSPKEITRTTAPKVVFYFLGTFLVLLFALPVSGLVAGIQSRDVGILLLVSLLVSVIGAFGFEAVKFVPLFDVFTRVLTGGGRPQQKDGKSGPDGS